MIVWHVRGTAPGESILPGAVPAGGDEGNRTPNPRLAKAVLCQLSYVPLLSGDVTRSARAVPPGSALGGLVPQIVLAGCAHLGEDEGARGECDGNSDELLHEDHVLPVPEGSWSGARVVGPAGFEPATSSLSATRSNQLSYGPLRRGRGYRSVPGRLQPDTPVGQSRSERVTSMPPTRSADTL